jgi:hypothetical protein
MVEQKKNNYLEEVHSLGDLIGVAWIMDEVYNKIYRPETRQCCTITQHLFYNSITVNNKYKYVDTWIHIL